MSYYTDNVAFTEPRNIYPDYVEARFDSVETQKCKQFRSFDEHKRWITNCIKSAQNPSTDLFLRLVVLAEIFRQTEEHSFSIDQFVSQPVQNHLKLLERELCLEDAVRRFAQVQEKVQAASANEDARVRNVRIETALQQLDIVELRIRESGFDANEVKQKTGLDQATCDAMRDFLKVYPNSLEYQDKKNTTQRVLADFLYIQRPGISPEIRLFRCKDMFQFVSDSNFDISDIFSSDAAIELYELEREILLDTAEWSFNVLVNALKEPVDREWLKTNADVLLRSMDECFSQAAVDGQTGLALIGVSSQDFEDLERRIHNVINDNVLYVDYVHSPVSARD